MIPIKHNVFLLAGLFVVTLLSIITPTTRATDVVNWHVPYLHQCNDTGAFDGRWACGPTSAVMALAYFKKLDNLDYGTDYGRYIHESYTCDDTTFNESAPAPGNSTGQGAYGYICKGGLADKDRIVNYLKKHGVLAKRYMRSDISESVLKEYLRKGSIVIAGTRGLLSGGPGHIILIRGYTDDGNYRVNDPYGESPYKDPQNLSACGNRDGEDVLYTWSKMNVTWVVRVSIPPEKKALLWLRSSQEDNGSWSDSTGITALVLLSFFNAGFTRDDSVDTDGDGTPDLQEGMAYLADHFDITTGYFYEDYRGSDPCYCYDTSLSLLAYIAADRGSGTSNYESVISKAKDYLLGVQYVDNPDSPDYGGWGYPRANWADLSNTQWVVMALDAAYEYLGLAKPSLSSSETWTNKLLTFLDHCQRPDGGFDYKDGYWSTSAGSMSAAGLWSLMLAGLYQPEDRITRVQTWISNNYTLDENPGRGSAALYYYYVSLAKALTMAGWNTITDSAGTKHDWYAELQAKLAALQATEGFWANSNDDEWEDNADLCTAYALLALETQQLPHGEQLSWVLTLHSPGTLHVYSPDGDHVGPNSAGGVEEDIPGSSYVVEPTGEQVITISGLEAGAYRVDLIGTSAGVYTLDSEVKQSGQVVSSKTFTGTLVKGQARVTNAVFTAMEGAVTQFMSDLQATPAGLTATSGNETVNLTWTPFSETGFTLAGYNVYRRTTYASEYTKITVTPVNTPSYRDAGLTNDVTYYYVVTAVSSEGSETPYSPEVGATPSLGVSGQTAKIICGPNPVGSAGVTFYYALPQETTEAQIMIFDISGRMVFKDQIDPTGNSYPESSTWDLTSLDGSPLENGAYIYVLIANGKAVAQGKMIVQW